MAATEIDHYPPAKKLRLTPEMELGIEEQMAANAKESEFQKSTASNKMQVTRQEDKHVAPEEEQGESQPPLSQQNPDFEENRRADDFRIGPSHRENSPNASDATACIVANGMEPGKILSGSKICEQTLPSLQDNPLDVLHAALQDTSLQSTETNSTVLADSVIEPMQLEVESLTETTYSAQNQSNEVAGVTSPADRPQASPIADKTDVIAEMEVDFECKGESTEQHQIPAAETNDEGRYLTDSGPHEANTVDGILSPGRITEQLQIPDPEINGEGDIESNNRPTEESLVPSSERRGEGDLEYHNKTTEKPQIPSSLTNGEDTSLSHPIDKALHKVDVMYGLIPPVEPTGKSQLPALGTNGECSSLSHSIADVPYNAGSVDGLLPPTSPNEAGVEFEYDSSPYESNPGTSSSSSSDDDSDSAEDYELLDPAEQARRLMEGDIGSDNEEPGKVSTNGQVRTLNEKPEEVVEIPDINVTDDMKIENLGLVEGILDNLVLIKANTSGEYQVLEVGSLLCLEDRIVIGVVAETLGKVSEPYYCVRFTNAETITRFDLVKETKIFYVPEHSTFVFTKSLQNLKGSDASNIHDEEVGDDEAEFSDDEAEAEHNRRRKMQRQERKTARDGPSRGRSGYTNGVGSRKPPEMSSVPTLRYDDTDGDEEMYTPLARPSSLNQLGNQGTVAREYPQEGFSMAPRGFRGRGNRGRGRFRGRGDRRESQNSQRQQAQAGPDLSLPPPPQFRVPPSHHAHGSVGPPHPPPMLPQPPYNPPRNGFQRSHFQNRGYMAPQQQFPVNHQYPPPYSHPHEQWQAPNQFPAPSQFPLPPHMGVGRGHPQLPPGAYVNPAFFGNQYQYPPE